MACFTPPPCGRATRVLTKSRGSPERLHAGQGSGAPRAPRLRPHPRMNWLSSIVKSHVFEEPPALTRACRIDQQNRGPLRQHEKRRGRLKRKPGSHPNQLTMQGDVHSHWTSEAVLQGLGSYTRGCAHAPPCRIFHEFEGLNPKKLAPEPLPRGLKPLQD